MKCAGYDVLFTSTNSFLRMPLIPAVRVNDFSYKGIVEGFKPNRAAQVYHNHSGCSAVNVGDDLIPYNPDMSGGKHTIVLSLQKGWPSGIPASEQWWPCSWPRVEPAGR